MLKKLLNTLVTTKDSSAKRAEIYRQIIRDEAKIGGQLFGSVPDGTRREFFCLDEHTWIWHEERLDAKKVRHTITTRYDVRPNGVFKAQDGQSYQPVSRLEAERLYHAMLAYNPAVDAALAPILAA